MVVLKFGMTEKNGKDSLVKNYCAIRRTYNLFNKLFSDFDEKRFEILADLLGHETASIYADCIHCPDDFLKYLKKLIPVSIIGYYY